MKNHFILFNESGDVSGAGFGIPPEGAIITDDEMSIQERARLYVDGENGLVPRPEVPAPTLSGDDLSIPSGPEGTVLKVMDKVSDEVMWEMTTDNNLTDHVLTLPDAGTYAVEIDPPHPWLYSYMEFSK